ncbi:hypothetical protein RDWZM_009494 [Blomia tropicalis]|uniref:Uncharacterized protein n=1 Tax=Blomia tropicalis TaxID=40697 RepID=A0A9Q0M5D4_BLOTA|nr:hypothetical protein RDWZM_009494 [Blomia tropicalis]
MLQPVLTTISPIYPIILLSLILSCYTQRHRTIVDDVQQYEYSESTRSNAILELMETPNSPSACNGPYEEIRFPEQMCFPLYDGTKNASKFVFREVVANVFLVPNGIKRLVNVR